jgi:hypothetical protein
MAIQKTLNLIDSFGIEVEIKDAYIKVERVEVNKIVGTATVFIFIDKNKVSIKTERFEYPVNLTGSNFIVQAYEYIKQLPEYAGAIDC